MNYDEVARRLLGESENDGPSQLPAEIIRYFADIVEFSSGKFADLQTRIDDNEHHIQVLERAKECSKAPHFLTLNTPKVRLFPEDSVAKLQQKFQKILDEASLKPINATTPHAAVQVGNVTSAEFNETPLDGAPIVTAVLA